jgi:hypothetical protein
VICYILVNCLILSVRGPGARKIVDSDFFIYATNEKRSPFLWYDFTRNKNILGE